MSVLIGHASISENKTVNGEPGDQTGGEVCVRSWYDKGWTAMAIHPDANVREKHAKAVEQACANDNIGYSQYGDYNRNTLNKEAKKVNYDLSKVGKCNCDCSSLQNVAAVASGADGASYGSNGWTTANMEDALEKAGYKIVKDKTYLKSSSYCVRGAIYITNGHTLCGLSNGSNYKKTLEKANASSSSASSTASSSSGKSVNYKVKINTPSGVKLRSGAGTEYSRVSAIPNGEIVTITKESGDWGYTSYGGKKGWICLDYTKKTTSSSGASSSKPTYKVGETYELLVDKLRVRTGPGTNYPAKSYSQLTANAKQHAYSNGTLKKGTAVTCQQVKNVGSDIWIKIPSDWIAAYYDGKKYVG